MFRSGLALVSLVVVSNAVSACEYEASDAVIAPTQVIVAQVGGPLGTGTMLGSGGAPAGGGTATTLGSGGIVSGLGSYAPAPPSSSATSGNVQPSISPSGAIQPDGSRRPSVLNDSGSMSWGSTPPR